MSKKFLGFASAMAAGVALAVPSGAQAQSAPTGCATVIPINLSPLVKITIKTCEAASAPECDGNSIYIPLDPIVRIRIDTCF